MGRRGRGPDAQGLSGRGSEWADGGGDTVPTSVACARPARDTLGDRRGTSAYGMETRVGRLRAGGGMWAAAAGPPSAASSPTGQVQGVMVCVTVGCSSSGLQ